MKSISLFAALATLASPLDSQAELRTFTDDQGRQIEAELVGVRGANVVLSRNGNGAQWPIAKLSAKDKAYVKTWQANPPLTPRVTVRLFERDGIGPSGKYEEKKGLELPNITGLIEKTETPKYPHYDIDLNTLMLVDATHLTVTDVMYVIGGPGGAVLELPASSALDSSPAQQRGTTTSLGATYVRTKTKLTTFSLNAGTLSSGTNRSTAKERFGGIWVRVYAQDGAVVGEAKDLHPEIERLKPAWHGPKNDEHIPLLEAFEKLEEFLKSLPKPPGAPSLPAKPDDVPKKPALPKPPGPPAPPFGK